MIWLTKQERQVVIFLVALALAGAGIDYFYKTYPRSKAVSFMRQGSAKLNLNQADKAHLMAIPGIKQKLAERIIFYRLENSRFNSLDELKNVKGIAERKFQKIKDYLFIDEEN